jgi:hypothetical protein
MTATSGTGRYIKTKLLPDTIILGDVYTYTGVSMKILLDDINISLDKYQITVTARDNWTTTYTINETLGDVTVYTENGTISENETAQMIVAYKENGAYYSEIDPNKEIGPLRIAFIGDHTPITPSGLWAKKITTIDIEKPT